MSQQPSLACQVRALFLLPLSEFKVPDQLNHGMFIQTHDLDLRMVISHDVSCGYDVTSMTRVVFMKVTV